MQALVCYVQIYERYILQVQNTCLKSLSEVYYCFWGEKFNDPVCIYLEFDLFKTSIFKQEKPTTRISWSIIKPLTNNLFKLY